MMLVIQTQYMENYGTPTDPYWKMKGGSEYKVTDLPSNIDPEEVVAMVRAEIEYNEPMCQQYILGWSMEADTYLSWFEKSQLEYDGSIQYPEPVLSYNELNGAYA